MLILTLPRYVKRNLGPTRYWWGECFFVWVFTRGVQFSNIVELWFLSVKFQLPKGGRPEPLLGLEALMDKTVKHRGDLEHTLAGVKLEVVALPVLVASATKLGFGKIVDVVEEFVGDDVVSKQMIYQAVGCVCLSVYVYVCLCLLC
jgi:hypothetical protein